MAPILEEFGPRVDVGVLFEEGASLAFGHPAPHSELDSVVESVGAALHEYRAVSADCCCLALRGTSNEKLIRIYFAASRLRDPGDASLCLFDIQTATRGGCVHSLVPSTKYVRRPEGEQRNISAPSRDITTKAETHS